MQGLANGSSSRRAVRPSLALGAVAMGIVAMGSLTAGCSDPDPIIPLAYVDATMAAGNNDQTTCNIVSKKWLEIGTPESSVFEGTEQNGAPVNVSCAVYSSDGGFRVVASAVLRNAGDRSGSISIDGFFTSSGTQNNIRAVFQNSIDGTFEQRDCTVEYRTLGMGIADGRVWGELSCPTMEFPDQARVCAGRGVFKFENCRQSG